MATRTGGFDVYPVPPDERVNVSIAPTSTEVIAKAPPERDDVVLETGVLPNWNVTPLCILCASTPDAAAAAPNLVVLESYIMILSRSAKLFTVKLSKSGLR